MNAWRFIMNKFTTLTAAGASALLLSLSAGAFAATAQPDAGNQPFASIDMSQSGTLQRSAVEAAAIRNAPAAGIHNASALHASDSPALSRAQVKQQTLAASQVRHGFAGASGLQNANF
ncbi:MAG: hypothetical protein ABT03_02690 [Comamonas sp. SCN 67-35]|nr:MAG: hypothetical protein ABT03_02690 [Comamonas sp. SCN 67-35]